MALILVVPGIPGSDAAARLTAAPEGPLVWLTSPGVAVEVPFAVRNDDGVHQTVNFTLVAPSGWTASVVRVVAGGTTVQGWQETVIAPGASIVVVTEVVPISFPRSAQVYFRAVGTSQTAVTYAVVQMPVFVDLVMHDDVFRLDQRVSGEVDARDLDGTPATGLEVEIVERQEVRGVGLPLARNLRVFIAPDGSGLFGLPQDLAGANAPGDHVVTARGVGIVNVGSSHATAYAVG